MSQDTVKNRVDQDLGHLADYQIVVCALMAVALVFNAAVEVIR